MSAPKIIGLVCVRNEVDILRDTLGHMFAHGVDHILALDHGSTDGTRELLFQHTRGKVISVREDSPQFYHEKWTNGLLGMAAAMFEDFWCIPFDADEFFIPLNRRTLAEELHALDETAPCVLEAKVYQHASRTHHAVKPLDLPKAAFRYTPGCSIKSGAHAINHPGPIISGLLEVREWHALNEWHFVEKTRKHLETRRPDMPEGESVKYAKRQGLASEDLRKLYRVWAATCVVFDPIPIVGA